MRRTARGSSAAARLRPGMVVEVKPVEEILATLDQDGAVDALPFMPEMLQFAGRRFTVSKRAEQSCDTIRTWVNRRMRRAVHLEDLRCDGSFHGGCQAGCRLFWKESWLRPVNGDGTTPADPAPPPPAPQLLLAGTRQRPDAAADGAGVRYRCQATEMFDATEPMRAWDLRRYWRELRSGNVSPLRLVTVLTRAGYRAVHIRVRFRLGRGRPLPLQGRCAGATPKGDLDLRPGEWVRVKEKEQIAGTLNARCLNRGLSFDWEMLPYCGRTFRVQERVNRIIDDRSGAMIQIGSDGLILEGVTCSGDRSSGRLFCPRAIYPYWREVWLERVDDPGPGPAAATASVGDQPRGLQREP